MLRDEQDGKKPAQQYLGEYLSNSKETFIQNRDEILDKLDDTIDKEIERLKIPYEIQYERSI